MDEEARVQTCARTSTHPLHTLSPALFFLSVSALLIGLKCFGLEITRGWKIHGACIYCLALPLTLHHI